MTLHTPPFSFQPANSTCDESSMYSPAPENTSPFSFRIFLSPSLIHILIHSLYLKKSIQLCWSVKKKYYLGKPIYHPFFSFFFGYPFLESLFLLSLSQSLKKIGLYVTLLSLYSLNKQSAKIVSIYVKHFHLNLGMTACHTISRNQINCWTAWVYLSKFWCYLLVFAFNRYSSALTICEKLFQTLRIKQ